MALISPRYYFMSCIYNFMKLFIYGTIVSVLMLTLNMLWILEGILVIMEKSLWNVFSVVWVISLIIFEACRTPSGFLKACSAANDQNVTSTLGETRKSIPLSWLHYLIWPLRFLSTLQLQIDRGLILINWREGMKMIRES